MNETKSKFTTEYIPLGQFLKLSDCIIQVDKLSFFCKRTKVVINGEPDNRRGRKLYPGDKVKVEGFEVFTVVKR